MGLFSRKPKEYVFDPLTGCAACKQSLEDVVHHMITFYDGHTARQEIVLRYLLHHNNDCYNQENIRKSQPAGTVLTDQYVVPRHVAREAYEARKREEKERKRLERNQDPRAF